MAVLTLIKAVQVDLTVREIARAFASMDDLQQAEFFNEVHNYVGLFYKESFDMQLCYVTGNSKLTLGGRQIMETIGIYSKED